MDRIGLDPLYLRQGGRYTLCRVASGFESSVFQEPMIVAGLDTPGAGGTCVIALLPLGDGDVGWCAGAYPAPVDLVLLLGAV